MSLSRRLANLFGVGILSVVALRLLRAYAYSSPANSVLWIWILISFVFHVAIYGLSALGWIRILAEMGEKDQAGDHMANYWSSLPFQFIGGFLGSSVGRVWLSKSLTIKNKTLVGALLIEKTLTGVYSLLALLTLTILETLLRRHPEIFLHSMGALIFLAFVSLGLFYSSSDSRAPSMINKIKIAALYLGVLQICDIFALFTLTKAIGHPTALDMVLISRAYIASWCLSQLAFIIPQGLGIREAIFAFFMRSSTGILWPITYALYARILSVGGQLFPILIFNRRWRTIAGPPPLK
jgi:uncharacterized membrane protein YbhN (UPF0104 family)